MRIVSGIYGGRKLEVPKGRDIRPTSDKVRGAVFNSLRSRGAVEGAHVLDAFCGTGALGLEALSQGAETCTFMDKEPKSLELAKRNALTLSAQAKFILSDASKPQSYGGEAYDLVFFDPPYEKGLISVTLQTLHEERALAAEAIIVCEAEKSWSGDAPAAYEMLDEKSYGDTKVVFFSYTNQPE